MQCPLREGLLLFENLPVIFSLYFQLSVQSSVDFHNSMVPAGMQGCMLSLAKSESDDYAEYFPQKKGDL